MKWNLYDDTLNQWGEVVIKQVLDLHEGKVASELEYGHVKIDGDTLMLDADGKLKVNDDISSTKSSTIYFNIGSDITIGRINEAYFNATFKFKIKEINVSLVNVSNENLVFNLQKTTDFVNYNDVLNSSLIVNQNTHIQKFTIEEDVVINKDELMFIDVKETTNDAKNMLVSVVIEKIQ